MTESLWNGEISAAFTVEMVTCCGVRTENTKPSWRAPSTNARSSVNQQINTGRLQLNTRITILFTTAHNFLQL